MSVFHLRSDNDVLFSFERFFFGKEKKLIEKKGIRKGIRKGSKGGQKGVKKGSKGVKRGLVRLCSLTPRIAPRV